MRKRKGKKSGHFLFHNFFNCCESASKACNSIFTIDIIVKRMFEFKMEIFLLNLSLLFNLISLNFTKTRN